MLMLDFGCRFDFLEYFGYGVAQFDGGDFGARALEWSMLYPDFRGVWIQEIAARTGIVG